MFLAYGGLFSYRIPFYHLQRMGAMDQLKKKHINPKFVCARKFKRKAILI